MKCICAWGLVALAAMILVVGCSGGNSNNPLLPSSMTENAGALSDISSPAGLNHYLWGYYLVRVDEKDFSAEIIPIRATAGHLNVLQFLEQGPCTNCFKLAGITPNPDGTLNVNVSITHPFTNLNLTGFDVRGIAMFNGSHLFPESGLIMSDRTLGDGEVVNADGYTSLYNPGTVGNGFEGYIKGKFATATVPTATLNAYKRFVTDDPANTRNAFYAGDEIVATYRVYLPDPPNPWILGYAVDACWSPAISKPVDDPMTDFGPEANCPEAWQISVSDVPISAGLTEYGGQVSVVVDVFDWQGKDDVHPPLVECPELYDGQVEAVWAEDGSDFARYEAVVENVKLAPAHTYLCLVRKEAAENDPFNKPWLDLAAHQVHELKVTQIIIGDGWARTWGGSFDDEGDGVAVDDSGNAYVTGHFYMTVDFDPGPGVDNHHGSGAFLSKFDSSGNFLWAKTWGATINGYGVATDGSGNAYVTGCFTETVDFDPGTGVDERTSNGGEDIFLSKFDPSGNFLWAKTWGGSYYQDVGFGVASDSSGNAYITGSFLNAVDFDPGPGEDWHDGNGVFLSKLDSSGSFLWARTWGGSFDDEGHHVAMDGSANPYVTGSFVGTVDFDPGVVVDNHTSNGDVDVFLSKFDSSGDFLWAETWGGTYADTGRSVAVDGSGIAYVTGAFSEDTVDFDPGGGMDNHTSKGGIDIFLSKFDPSGDFLWAKTWGGSSDDEGYHVAIDGSANPYVTGCFFGSVDFDPGSGVDSHISNGDHDVFLGKFDSSGDFLWAVTWGGIYSDKGYGVAADDSGNAHVTGYFSDTVDFDPGSGVDNHASNGSIDIFLSRFLPDGSW